MFNKILLGLIVGVLMFIVGSVVVVEYKIDKEG